MENFSTIIQIQRMEMLTSALRTGNKPQAHSQLNIDNRGYCCLGLGCEVAMENGLAVHKARLDTLNRSLDITETGIGADEIESLSSTVYAYDGWVYFLPPRVQMWYGFKDTQASFINAPKGNTFITFRLHTVHNLAELNDMGASFAEIADVIDENWINPLKEAA